MPASPLSFPDGFEPKLATPVNQGECRVSGAPEATFSTVLGSCIAACIHDRVAGFGGMNHFLLPAPSELAGDRFGAPARYGAFAMEELINKVLAGGSGRKANLVVKIFGGGLINGALSDVGAKNIAFVRKFLADEGYGIDKEDLGGDHARRVLFRPHIGRAFVKRLDMPIQAIAREELAAARQAAYERAGEIELF